MSSWQPTAQIESECTIELQWERLKALIRTKYLFKNESLEKIAEALKHEPLAEGLNISKQIVEKKLKKWGFYKNLRVENWQYIGHAIVKRKKQNKESVVILSGKRLDPKVVASKINRHNPPTYTAPKIKAPGPTLPLNICTPRAADIDAVWVPNPNHYQPWPEDLPWFEFNRTIIFQIVDSVSLLQQPETAQNRRIEDSVKDTRVVSHTNRNKRVRLSNPASSEALHTSHIYELITRHIMNVIVGSVELASSLVASQSIDRLAGSLDRVIPESFYDENICRASLLIRGTYKEQQKELLTILIYLISNRLIFYRPLSDHRPLSRRYFSGSLEHSQYAALLQFCRAIGLANYRGLSKLVNLSRRSLALTSVVNVLFNAAVVMNDLDITRTLLKADDRINADREVFGLYCEKYNFRRSYDISYPPLPGLHASIVQGHISMTKTLISAGADPNLDSNGWSALALAARCLPSRMAAEIVSLLLQKGAKSLTFKPLELAALTAKAELAKLLRAKGIPIWHDFVDTSSGSKDPLTSTLDQHKRHQIRSWRTDAVEWALSPGAFGFLCLAACADTHVDISDQDECAIGIEANIISTMKVFRDEIQTPIKAECWLVDVNDAMIVAAARGHTYVLEFLYNLQVETTGETRSKHLYYTLLISIQCCQLEACRLLLSWGAPFHTSNPDPGDNLRDPLRIYGDPRRLFGNPALPLIHLAVIHNSFELLDLCLEQVLVTDINVPAFIPVGIPAHVLGEREDLILHEISHKRSSYIRSFTSGLGYENILSSLREQDEHEKCFGTYMRLPLRPVGVAIRANHVQMALYLLGKGALVTECDLFHAARNGQNVVVEMLLNRGISPNAAGEKGTTALAIAVSEKHESVAIQLLKAGAIAGPHVIDFGDILQLSDDSLVRQLLNCYGAIPAVHKGKSYLEWALIGGIQSSIDAALWYDASAYHYSILDIAISREVDQPCTLNMTLLKEIIRRSNLPQNICKDIPGVPTAAVRTAICNNRLDLVDELRKVSTADASDNKTNLDAWNSWLGSPYVAEPATLPRKFLEVSSCMLFHVAMGNTEYSCSESLVLGLLESGFHVDKTVLERAINNDLSAATLDKLVDRCRVEAYGEFFIRVRSLEKAIRAGLPVDLLDKLIHRCNIKAEEGKSGVSLLHIAICYSDRRLVLRLLKNGAHLHAIRTVKRRRINSCENPLVAAVWMRDLNLIQLLLQRGADPDQYLCGPSPLTVAAINGDIGIVKCLLDFGANREAARQVTDGIYPGTPLEGAAASGRVDVVHLLLTRGLDTEDTGRVQYVRAVRFSEKAGHNDIAQMLRKHRPWSPEDDELCEEFKNHPCIEACGISGEIFLHPLEYHSMELRKIIHHFIKKSHCEHEPIIWWEGNPSTKSALKKEIISVLEEISVDNYIGQCHKCLEHGWKRQTFFFTRERLERERLERERLKQERLKQERLKQKRLEQEQMKALQHMMLPNFGDWPIDMAPLPPSQGGFLEFDSTTTEVLGYNLGSESFTPCASTHLQQGTGLPPVIGMSAPSQDSIPETTSSQPMGNTAVNPIEAALVPMEWPAGTFEEWCM